MVERLIRERLQTGLPTPIERREIELRRNFADAWIGGHRWDCHSREVYLVVDFEWDPKKAAGNLKKHGIDFHEAVTVLDDTLSTTFPDLEYSTIERRFVTVGMSGNGRLLVVVHAENEDTIRIISARGATRREQRFYEEGYYQN